MFLTHFGILLRRAKMAMYNNMFSESAVLATIQCGCFDDACKQYLRTVTRQRRSTFSTAQLPSNAFATAAVTHTRRRVVQRQLDV